MNSSIADSVSFWSLLKYDPSSPSFYKFNLGWKLALVLKGQAQPSLLNSYELERIPIISEMLQISTSLHDKGISEVIQLAKEVAKQ